MDEREKDLSLGGENDLTTEKHAKTGESAAAGAISGGIAGALVGGPPGAAVGAIGGAALGAVGERIMHGRPGHQHVEGDEAHYTDDHAHSGPDDGHEHRFH
ncbi:MAG: hypothetical protein NVSMB2_11830 [Chloroflexota bacterium]